MQGLALTAIYSKTFLKRPLKKADQKLVFKPFIA